MDAGLAEPELEKGKVVGVQVDGAGVLVVRKGEPLYAVADRCSHCGCTLHRGELKDNTVVCVCHGSTFRLSDGRSSRVRRRHRRRSTSAGRGTRDRNAGSKRPIVGE
jgi:3-phenylpropionate/trans-cinnamate dioxygenase ferredoxin subunit